MCNSPRLQRLLLRLSQYDVNIEYLKGKDNIVADALSRVSPQPTPKEGEDEEDFIPVHMLTEEIPADSTRVGDFRRATAEDTISGLLMQVVAKGWPELKKDCHPLLVDYWSYTEEISAENGQLFKGYRIIVPQGCEVCQMFSRSQQRETLLPNEVPQGPWEKLGIDFFEFQSTTHLLIADYYSRFPVIQKVHQHECYHQDSEASV